MSNIELNSDWQVFNGDALSTPITSQSKYWNLSNRADPRALPLADRHYNRQKPGSPQFVPPGRCLVLLTENCGALWVTSWPFAQYVKHSWAGAWVNSMFRRESGPLASALIRDAVSVTRSIWPDIPPLGIISFVDASKISHKRDPGRCYLRAGFRLAGHTKGGLLAFQLLPDEMPEPLSPLLRLSSSPPLPSE